MTQLLEPSDVQLGTLDKQPVPGSWLIRLTIRVDEVWWPK